MKPYTLLRLRSVASGGGASLPWLHTFGGWVDLVGWDDCFESLKKNNGTIPLIWIEVQDLSPEDWKNIRECRKLAPGTSLVLYSHRLSLVEYQKYIQSGHFFQIGTAATPVETWTQVIRSAMDRFAAFQRYKNLLQTSKNRNARLIRMTHSMEQQVQRKTKKLFISTKKLQEHEKQLEAIQALLVQINAADGIKGIYVNLAKQLAHLLSFTELSIVMKDWAGRGFIVIKGTSMGDASIETLNADEQATFEGLFNGLEPAILSPSATIAASQQSMFNHSHVLKTRIFELKKHASLLFLPLSIGSGVKGAIFVGSFERQGFTKEHVETLRHLQPPLSVALDRVYKMGALKHLQEQWEATFHTIHDPLLLLSEEKRLIRTNDAADHLFRELPLLSDSLESFLKKNTSLLKAGHREFRVVRMPFTYRTKNLTLLHLREVTEERELLQQLLQSEKLASVGVLSEKVAHELNNPLAGIMALSQILQSELDEPYKADILEVERACRRCKHIIENLVEFSTANRMQEKTSINLNTVVEETLSLARAGLNGLKLNLSLEANMPSLLGCFQELQQVLFNLIQNSAQSIQSADTEGVLSMSTLWLREENVLIFRIRDSGEGIPEHCVKQIFDPFFTTKRAGIGTGLGLSICKKIISQHGGQISLIWTEPGKGTEFEIRLPVMEHPAREQVPFEVHS